MNSRNVRCNFIILLILAGRLPGLFEGSVGSDDKLICHGSYIHVIFSYQPKARSGKKELKTFARVGKVGNSNAISECQYSKLLKMDHLMVHLILQSNSIYSIYVMIR